MGFQSLLDLIVIPMGVVFSYREDIPTKLLFRHSLPDDIEGMFIELNFRKSKWLLGGIVSST